MEAEKKLLMGISEEEKSRLTIITKVRANAPGFSKTSVRSEEVRRKGNELYSRKHHDAETHREIFSYYSESIALAPLESEVLAQAYGNRSAFLLHIQKHEECIKDIDRALEITKSDVLRIKLLCREVECMKKMGLSNYGSVLDEVDNYAKEVDESNKAQVNKFINNAKTYPVSNDKSSRDRSNESDIVLPKMDDTLDRISIEHNEKWGRHLVAQKDYAPGDLICSEDIYVTLLNQKMSHTNCNYCLKICWSGIACDYCSWAMFCNEDCRKKAWDAFHDVECTVAPFVKEHIGKLIEPMDLALRMLLVGVREAGSIAKLKEELQTVDRCTDVCYKGFYKNGRFISCSIRGVYSLKARVFSELQFHSLAVATLIVLIAIVQNNRLIKNFELKKIDDILANEDLVFLGSLLIKFTAINPENCHQFMQNCMCKRLKSPDEECCSRGVCLASLSSLVNHSCHPNACLSFSEDKKITFYALQTIKKNSQIFITYAGSYYDIPLNVRKKKLDLYKFTCKCQACIDSWPVTNVMSDALPRPSDFETMLYLHCKHICAALDSKKLNFNKKDFNQKQKEKLCDTITEVERLVIPNRPKPNVLSTILERALKELYLRFYGWIPPIVAFKQCDRL